MPTLTLYRLALLACLALGGLAQAQSVSYSGFGTLGYAISDRDFVFERSIDRRGTFNRDSVVGLQADVKFDDHWSATAQISAAQSLRSDTRWDVTPSWAFLAWRPNDDWLLRAGAFRVPLYLHSESMDVGVTSDMVRMPAEIYAMAPSTNFDGLYGTRTWALGAGDLDLDVYSGTIKTWARLWYSEGLPPQVPAGAQFVGIEVRSTGAVLTLRQPDGLWRLGVHDAQTRRTAGTPIPVSFPYVPLGPGLGYYQVSDQEPGPGVPTDREIENFVLTMGFEKQIVGPWRVAAEFARNFQRDTEVGSDTRGGYVVVSRKSGVATPYVSLSAMRSSGGSLAWFQRLTSNPLPAAIPGAAALNAAQLTAAQSFYAIDQRSVALGSAFSLGPTQKIKVEWMHTRIGQTSYLVQTPLGGTPPHDTDVNVLSINYNVSF